MELKTPSLLKPGQRRDRLIYWAVWLALAAPLPLFLWTGQFGIMRDKDALVPREGLWAIRILLVGFALSPAARLLRLPILHRYKRTAGLFGFVYATLHGVFYLFYGRVWEFPLRIWQRRLYIPLGILALVMLLPLAITSTDGMLRRMGPRGWRILHRSVYPLMLVIAIHALWQSNIDYAQPSIYLGLTVLLLAVRLPPVMNWLMRLTAGKGRAPARALQRAA